ncbi:hypothetical protein DH2020_045396 [Rehmannia glutinosa]|uniref:AIG1-type G domain-containing protein n=1 Tax=Rehmannia glutinosa TaxID=99300 RepID=A0ABR0UEW3_REHGL
MDISENEGVNRLEWKTGGLSGFCSVQNASWVSRVVNEQSGRQTTRTNSIYHEWRSAVEEESFGFGVPVVDFSLMENGIGIAEDAKLRESNAVNSEVLEPSIKESVDLSLDGSKDSDGDEVFEEAVEAETASIGSEISTVTNGENGELVGTLENNKGNSDVFHDVQKFEAVIGAPSAVQSSEDAGAGAGAGAKTELLMSEENHDENQIDMEKIVMDETNGLIDDSIADINDSAVEDRKADSREIVDSASTAGETENLNDGYEKLDNSNQKPEDNISGKMSFLEALTSGDAKILSADNGEELNVEMSETLEPNELSKTETHPEKLDVKTLPHEMAEIQGANEVKRGDICPDIPENGSLDHVNMVSTLNHENMKSADFDELKEQIHETSPEIEDEDAVKESEAGPRSESESNGDAVHKNEHNAILGAGNQQDKRENNSAYLHSNSKRIRLVSRREVTYFLYDENAELKKLDLEFEQVEKADSLGVDQENSGIAASDISATDPAKESSGLDTNLHPVLDDDSTLNLEKAEVEPRLSSSELLAESPRSSEPQLELVDANAEVSTNIVERQQQDGVKDEKKELYLSGNGEQEVTPVTGISSTSGIAPAHPADLDNAAKVQEHVSQDASANAKQEIKSAADISSANSVTAPPAGLRQDTPLLESASQNKERGSRSTADNPPINISSATPARPAGLGRAAPLLEPTSRVVQQPRVNGAVSATQNQLIEDPTAEAEEYDETREKLQMIRVKFLRLAHRLGQTPHNVVVAQVLYRLGLAEQLHGRSGGRVAAFSFDRASAMAEQLEAAGQEPLDFTCTIMVLGKSGVGKSATINSIFDENMFGTDAFQLGTKKVQDIVGTVQGIRVRVIDTPGLLPSWSDQRQNEKILRSVKRFIKKTPPDIVLYLDRLDMQSRDFGDMPLLRTITEIFGPSIWFNAIVVLTHAASAPPEGPNGTATRSHVVQQAIRQAAGDMRLMNPVSLVENHSACRTNRAGQRVLPNGQVWKPHLLLLSFASKILAEANTLLKLQDTPPGRPFAPRTRSPPLPFLLSSLLQSRPEIKLPSEQFGDDDDDAIDDDLDECSDSDEESEYDELPPSNH